MPAADRYNMNDPELAKQKLEEAGYDGTPIRFMSTQEYGYMYATSTVAVQQLEAVGFVMDHQVTDWATVVERRAKPEEWDMFVTGHGFVPDPSQISYVGQMNIYPGWWNDPDSLELATQLLSPATFEERMPLWEQIQANAYTQIPAIKIGDGATISSRLRYDRRLGVRSSRGLHVLEPLDQGVAVGRQRSARTAERCRCARGGQSGHPHARAYTKGQQAL